jgi:hypothetical protein
MIDRVRKYIESVKWHTARSGDHAYTLYKWKPELYDEFAWLVMYIREVGDTVIFKGTKYICLHLDGMRYWTMGAPLASTILINRCKADPPVKKVE